MKISEYLIMAGLMGMVTIGYAAPAQHVHVHHGKRHAAVTVSQPVNINRADEKALATVKGIGPRRAQLIVGYRTAHGPFKSTADLVHVKGIGQKRLAKFGKQLTV